MWPLIVALSVFSIGGGVSVHEGIISLTGKPVLADPTWNHVVLGVGFSHAFKRPDFASAASVLIGLVLIASAGLLARKSVSLLVGASLDRDQLALLRKILLADPAVESVGHLLTMRLGPESVLLTAAARFQRRLNLDDVEQAIDRLERAIKVPYPSILRQYLESGALKQAAHAAAHAVALAQARVEPGR